MSNSQHLIDWPEVFRHNMRRFREECGWTQQDLADAMGVQRSYVSDIERRRNGTSLDKAAQVAWALDIDMRWFFVPEDEISEIPS